MDYRWQCSRCKTSFSVTVNTLFHRTRLPLPKWFLAIILISNALFIKNDALISSILTQSSL